MLDSSTARRSASPTSRRPSIQGPAGPIKNIASPSLFLGFHPSDRPSTNTPVLRLDRLVRKSLPSPTCLPYKCPYPAPAPRFPRHPPAASPDPTREPRPRRKSVRPTPDPSKVHPKHTQSTPKAHPKHTQSTPKAHPKHTQSTPKAHPHPPHSHCTFTLFPSCPTSKIRLPNSTPRVGSDPPSVYRSSVSRMRREDLPTEASPTMTYLRMLRG
ncbi:hypothetical protein EHS25_005424 [Saitozyma podzolica]|uniref:Uncharacterized protein n=1 Tax=Saitozyma podzolica TaxID=1890683 RepID=A0A427XY82_9TREE|nr:hypothetical protein EHS25_005424 [Saitozyma podzolica]